MSEFTVFAFDSTAVRTVLKDGEPWFAATDVSDVLGYRDAANMTRMLDDDEKGTHTVRTAGGNQVLLVISESGMYMAIMKSRKPEAKRFKRWVTHEVLPSIRKTGRYVDPSFRAPIREATTMLSADTDQFVSARRVFCSSISAARQLRMPLPQAVTAAGEVAMRRTGVDMLAELDAAEHVARLGRDAVGGAFGDRSLPMHLEPFWEDFAGGQIDPRLPATMLASQFNTLYRHWCLENGYSPLTEGRLINALKTADVLDRCYLYHTDAERRHAYRDYFVVTEADVPPPNQLQDPQWMGDRVQDAEAILGDLLD